MDQKKYPARPGEATNVHRLRKLSGAAAKVAGRDTPYSDQERQEAVALAWEVGVRAAAEQLGINAETVAYWKDKQRRDLQAARADYLASGGTLAEGEKPPDWRTQREREANAAGLDARIVRDTATQAMLDGNWQLVRAGAAYYAVLVDRAQVLTAGKVPIPVTREEARREERRIIEDWKDRAEQAGNTVAAEALQARLDQLGGEAS